MRSAELLQLPACLPPATACLLHPLQVQYAGVLSSRYCLPACHLLLPACYIHPRSSMRSAELLQLPACLPPATACLLHPLQVQYAGVLGELGGWAFLQDTLMVGGVQLALW